MQQNYNKKRKLNKLKASLLMLMMVLFAGMATAQTNNVYMHTGETYVSTSGLNFYDSGGASHGPANYWNHWFGSNQDFTHVFRPQTEGQAIQVDFEEFTAYTDNNGTNPAHNLDGQFSLRLNNAELYVYEGAAVNEDNLITVLTGTIVNPFTIMANGPITFRFKSYGYTEEGWGARVKAVAATEYKPQAPAISMEVCSDRIVLNATTLGAQIRYSTNGATPTATTGTVYTDPFYITYPTTVRAITVKNNVASEAYAEKEYTANDATPTPRALVNTDIVRNVNEIIITPPEVPDRLNETYSIIYTFNQGSAPTQDPVYLGFENPNNVGTYKDPDRWNGAMPGKVHFEWTQPNTYFKICVVAKSCGKQSAVYEYHFENMQVPDPVIADFTENTSNNTGSTTITWANGYVIRYTTNGTTPTTTSGTLVESGTSVDLSGLAPGTTVKAIAYKAGDDNYDPSKVVSKLYLPNNGQSGTSGDMVILNDLEDHSWSYYSDADNPVRSLKPVDVKITYNGNGTGNMTSSNQNGATPSGFSENATGVKVGVDAPESSFMYLKTLERADGDNGTGRCEYTVIPNPFSVRPTLGSGDSRWRGFYAWRLKSIAGGSVYDVNGNALTAGTSTVNAEAKLYFEPASGAGDDDMIEVVFEALWAQAYLATAVNNTNTLNANVSYERNFVRTTSNISNVNSRNATIMSIYPNGTTDGTNAASTSDISTVTLSDFSCSADTKFENIGLTGTNTTVTANNHYLCFGRGVSGTVNYIRGIGANVGSNSNRTNAVYTIRLESGTFTYLSFTDGYESTTGSSNNSDYYLYGVNNSITGVLGCDYDRASENGNDNLTITGTVIMGAGVRYPNQDVTKKTLDVTVKSGKFFTSMGTNMGTADAHQSFYMSNVNRSGAYVGERKLTIEGGILTNIAGGVDSGNQGNNDNHVRSFTFRMKGGTVNGAIYGGGAVSPASGDRHMVFTGGTVKGWIGAGCNGVTGGSATTGGETNGESFVYVGGKTSVGGSATINGSDGGTVFGAGKGSGNLTTEPQSGRMTFGTNLVIADECDILNNVYGGGNYGFAQEYTNLYVLGGTVQGNVFGGSNQNNAPKVTVYMKNDAVVEGSIYGGSNTSGTNNDGATVNVSGGTVTNVFGGGLGEDTDMASGTVVNVSGGTINNNVYGGGEKGTVSAGNTVVNVSGGTMNDVYGAGKGEAAADGSKALISGSTTVNVTGGTVANVYGGGENGNVVNNTSSSNQASVVVTLSGSTSTNRYINISYTSEGQTITQTVYWQNPLTHTYDADYGTAFSITGKSGAGNGTRNITVTVNGEEKLSTTLANLSTPWSYSIPEQLPFASTVTINGNGNVNGDVFGGGAYGKTTGNVVVNMKGGAVHGSVYGGALGEQHSVYVAGTHTVNVMGGRVYANVYGGSRNADDALSFSPGTFASATNEETVCAVNVSGGQVDQQVYAAGYFGNCFGSVFAFVGQNAIYKAPNHVETSGSESAGEAYEATKLYIVGSVWAGGDWGTFTNEFGGPTITGKSNVYVDGEGYNTFTTDKSNGTYMCIDGSLFGSGTSCDAGKKEHTVMLRNYGQSEGTYATASRDFASIQRADYLVLDNVHVDFQGQGRINSLIVTEVYAIYEVSKAVIATGGSTLIMDAPTDQVMSFISASCSDVFTATLPTSETALGGYTAITPSTLSATPNKIRVNGGNYLKIYHDKQIATTNNGTTTYTAGYGMLKGYSYMMASSGDNEATCAYARPRWCENDDNLFHENDGVYDNRYDGGFVSYVSGDNVFDEEGNNANPGVQMAYENHTPGSKLGEQYFRIWRTTGQIHEREGVFDVYATGANVFKYVDVEIELPAWRGHDYYYKFETKGTAPGLSTTTDYGTELMTFNAAIYGTTNGTDQWIYYDTQAKAQKLGENEAGQTDIRNNPDVNYGLVILPGTGDALSSPAIGETAAPALIINNDADDFLAKVVKPEGSQVYEPVNTFTFTSNETAPIVTFRLTYSDLLSSNKTYEPMWVNLVQCDKDGNVKDIVKVKLVVNTSTMVGRDFETSVYAVMNGEGSTADEAHVQIVLPRFDLNTPGKDSQFTVQSIDWTPAQTTDGPGNLIKVADGSGANGFNKTNIAMEFSATENYDGTTGWNELNPTVYDTKVVYDGMHETPATIDSVLVGTTGGRSQFSLDFNLSYNGQVDLGNKPQPELMGVLVYHMKFTNYVNGDANHGKEFTVTINVYRRGKGGTYYLDGVNGKNSYDASRPDRAMFTLGALFNRSGFLPGDVIYVVNQVTADDGLEWNGLAEGGQVKLYRYNGGHELYDEEVGIIDNEDNVAYTWGPLVKVPDGAHMVMRGIDLDGYYMNGGSKDESTSVTSAAPLVSIEDGGTLELNQRVLLEQNYNTGNGGAVSVADGGTLMMNHDATIKDNKTDGEGAGVYMNGTMIASDQVKVWDNKKGDAQNNVFLAGTDRVLQIGVDMDDANYKDLAYDAEKPAESAKIGLSKPINYFTAGVAEVVYSKETDWLVEPLGTQAIIVHDGNIYRLETGVDPNKLYWRDTWVTWVTSRPEGFALNNIDSEEDLAWVISIVNGENGCSADALGGETVVIMKDLDMKDHTWVPIGEDNDVFKGTFEGNGHVVEGIISSLNRTNLGMFGITNEATIQNLVVKCDFNGVANNVGTVIGTMDGGLLSNVEAAGDLTGDAQYTNNIGGLVGEVKTGSTIHSAFAVNTINGQRTETVIGGLVAVNGGNLYNSYANVTLASGSSAATKGGLVGTNSGTIENCYVINPIGPAFAANNTGTIDICYAPSGTTSLVGTGTTGSGCGTYGAVKGAKEIGYMYGDNAVSATNEYVVSQISYTELNEDEEEVNVGHITKWPGLLSSLNQWVKAGKYNINDYAPWFRSTSSYVEDGAVDAYINGDLPVLGFNRDNCLATTDGKYLFYGSNIDANGLDNLFETFAEEEAAMFLYGNAAGVEGGTGDNHLFINEDAVLLQKEVTNGSKAYETINATTGITFDNSSKSAHDYYGNPLNYDWHFMSTPLSNASTGATYTSGTFTNSSPANISGMEDGYFPNELTMMNGDVKWDFYTYYEPQYHWINLKRGPGNHWHTDGGAIINYEEADNTASGAIFVPGKGYMMAISQDSYMSNTGTLNNGDVTITLTNQEPNTIDLYNKGWNLVGNPYQAYLDLNKVGTGTYYIYDAESGVYVAYAVTGSENPVTPSRYIHPHQGFFMYSASDGAEFTFKPSMATTEKQNGSYFRGDEQINYPLVNLFVKNQAGNRDLTVIEFNRPEIGGATKVSFMTNANFSIAAHLDNESYGLLFTPEGTEKVPVHFVATEDGTYTLDWSTYNGDFTSLLLVDNMTGVITDMLRSDSYTFEASKDDYASRFYITYTVTGVDEYSEGDGSFAFFDGSDWIVNGKGQLDIVDVTGRVLFSKRIANEQNRVSLGNVAPGVYMMRVTDGKNTMVQKIVVR